MLKRSKNYKGYILFESLIALGLMCLIMGSYVSFNTFLLKKNKQADDKMLMHRILYEEVKRYENYGGQPFQEVHLEKNNYQLHFQKIDNKLSEVEITDGKEIFTVKKE
ncbi:hypothetical protein DOK67_0001923 [Enterococcus sp. DIV0212c]|uniref:competence type IV pilus minor pilin ComGE n=1 Tax=Enterococcus sp. DIV0212c TaxID=2230867 RepID=UPI001A9ACCB2|nr:competence type IV pilus minor pilin ComGE [Enterococcus sp. DIV0212c]MBO1352389.1 type II secretion system protein [Enterococcus sp. DIV0212c]